MDGGLKRRGGKEKEQRRGGEKEGADCEEAFSCVSSHLQVRQRGEWASD